MIMDGSKKRWSDKAMTCSVCLRMNSVPTVQMLTIGMTIMPIV